MQIDVKKLYMTGYFGVVALNIMGAAFLILIWMTDLYALNPDLIQAFSLGGVFALCGVTLYLTNRLRMIMYAPLREKGFPKMVGEDHKWVDDFGDDMDMNDLEEEQDNK